MPTNAPASIATPLADLGAAVRAAEHPRALELARQIQQRLATGADSARAERGLEFGRSAD
jgi:hypothetical protein